MRHGLTIFVIAFALLAPAPARAQEAAPYAIDIPPWFANTFLDLREDIAEATRNGRRLLVYFGQDGCPYCKQLMVTNFSQRSIVEKTRQHFVALAMNMWGDREVTWLDGRVMTEKELARVLKVQFTPTLLFFDEKGNVVARLNGYYPPQRFEPGLDCAAGPRNRPRPPADLSKQRGGEPPTSKLHDEPFFLGPPYDLRRKPGAKPLAVLFETTHCSPCDELHREGLQRDEGRALVSEFDVARFSLAASTPLTSPAGRATTAQAWARELGVAYTPTIVFFDRGGMEVFRIDAYLRPFHLAASFDYVAGGGSRGEPSFQRYLQARVEHLRARGETVDPWR